MSVSKAELQQILNQEQAPDFVLKVIAEMKNINESFLLHLNESFQKQNFTEEERLMIQFYQDSGYETVNQALRGILTGSSDFIVRANKKRGSELAKVIEKFSITEDLILVRIEAVKSRTIPEKGEVFSDDSFVSASLNMQFILSQINHMRENGFPFIIKFIETPMGTKGLIMPEKDQSETVMDEFEILLQLGTSFKVIDSETVGDITFQHLKIVNQ